MTSATMVLKRTKIDGISLAWRDRPAVQPVAGTIVCLHGLGASSLDFTWLSDASPLAPYRLIAIDAAGHGASTRPMDWSYSIENHARIVGGLLKAIDAGPITLLGHSMGGSIAIDIATHLPALVERLIVAEPALDPSTGTLSAFVTRQSEERFVQRGHAALRYQTERAAHRGDASAARFLPSLELADPVAMYRSAASLRAERMPTFRDLLDALPLSISTIWGEQSPAPDPSLRRSDIRQIVLPDAGHQMMVDNPSGFLAALLVALSASQTH